MSVVLLYLLALTDWGFAGYRHAAGRDGRIFKGAYYRRAVAVALAWAQLPILVVGVVVGLFVAGSVDGEATFATMSAAASTMVRIYAVYATTVILAFVPYLFGNTEIRTLATVSVFGPLTLLRPVVILGGAVATVVVHADMMIGTCVAVAALANLIAEPMLARVHPL